MFAHGSSDCHLGWQMIKRVNQGQSWKWQGERERGGVCAAPGGTRLRRRAGLAAARQRSHFSSRSRRAAGGDGVQNVTGEILLTLGGNFTPNPSACTSHAAPPSPKGDTFQLDQPALPQQSQGRMSFWLVDATV